MPDPGPSPGDSSGTTCPHSLQGMTPCSLSPPAPFPINVLKQVQEERNSFWIPVPDSELYLAHSPISQSLLWHVLIFMAAWTECRVSERVSLGSRPRRAATHLRPHRCGPRAIHSSSPEIGPGDCLVTSLVFAHGSPCTTILFHFPHPHPSHCLTARTNFPFSSKCFPMNICYLLLHLKITTKLSGLKEHIYYLSFSGSGI